MTTKKQREALINHVATPTLRPVYDVAAELAREVEELRAALVQFDNCVDEFLDHITARDFLHLRGPSEDDMAWLRGFIRFCSLSEEMKKARAALQEKKGEDDD